MYRTSILADQISQFAAIANVFHRSTLIVVALISGCAKFEARMAIMGDDDIPIVVSFLLMGTCQVSIRLGKGTPRHRFLQPRSVGHIEVLDCHQNAVEKNRETLSYQKALNAEQERDVERVRQRDELLSKLKYDMKKSEYLKVKDQEKEAKQKMEGAAKTLNDIREPIETWKNWKSKTIKQDEISKAEKDLADAELELHNLPRYEPPKEKIEKLTTEILDLEQSAKQKRYQTKDKEKLLDQNRVLVNISNAQHAAYLEKQIPYYMWKAFITQNSAERDYLVKNLMSFDVAVINHLANVHRTYTHVISILNILN
ncbi:structural maintenance of chromosomes protein 5 [Tanacetum coccineum]